MPSSNDTWRLETISSHGARAVGVSIVVTASLASPAQSARTDILGFGLMLYELLTGRRPFDPRPGRTRSRRSCALRFRRSRQGFPAFRPRPRVERCRWRGMRCRSSNRWALCARGCADLFTGDFGAILERFRDTAQRIGADVPSAAWWIAQAENYAGQRAAILPILGCRQPGSAAPSCRTGGWDGRASGEAVLSHQCQTAVLT